jgi:hypothetical protein
MKQSWLLVLVLASSGCTIPIDGEGGDWEEGPVLQKSFEEIWTISIATVESKGFKIQEQDPSAGTFETEWRTTLSPRWREGHRDRIELEIVPGDPQAKAGFKIRVRVPREVNDNGRSPLSEKEAEWTSAGGNDAIRDEIGYLLKMKLKGLELGD